MIVSINRIMSALEGRVFSYGLALCLLFRVIRSINEFSTGQSDTVLVIGLVNLAILVLMLTLLKRYKTLGYVTLHSMFITTTFLTWDSAGGYQGIIPYAIIALIAFAIFSAHGILLAGTLIAYMLVTIYLTVMHGDDPVKSEPLLMTEINFLLCTFILISLCVFAKNRFQRYREYIQSVNRRLDTSSAILNDQAKQLSIQADQLLKLRNELEAKIAVKHIERDKKRAILSKYAFVNAHHVRGPVARILGLIALMEKEKLPRDRRRYLETIKSDAHEIDAVIRKIGEVLAD